MVSWRKRTFQWPNSDFYSSKIKRNRNVFFFSKCNPISVGPRVICCKSLFSKTSLSLSVLLLTIVSKTLLEKYLNNQFLKEKTFISYSFLILYCESDLPHFKLCLRLHFLLMTYQNYNISFLEGSRFIQDNLDRATLADKELIFKESNLVILFNIVTQKHWAETIKQLKNKNTKWLSENKTFIRCFKHSNPKTLKLLKCYLKTCLTLGYSLLQLLWLFGPQRRSVGSLSGNLSDLKFFSSITLFKHWNFLKR